MAQNPFSLIADFDGNIADLFKIEVDATLPILPLRNIVLYPGVVAPIAVGRKSSLQLIKDTLNKGNDALIAVSCQVDPAVEVPQMADLYPTGTVARVLRLIELPNHHTTAIVQAYGRVALGERPTRTSPYLRTHVTSLPETLPNENDDEFRVLYETFREATINYIKGNDSIGQEAVFALQNISDPVFFINFVATNLPFDIEEKALLLEEGDLKKRTFQLLHIVQRELQFLQIRHKIQERTREEIDQQQKEYFLHQTIKNIQNELGNGENDEFRELRQKAESNPMSEAAKKIVDKELARLERTNPQSPEYNVGITYLETVLSLPWGIATTDNLDLKRAQRILDRDHFGMEKVKERILEHLAIMKVSAQHRPAIICLYGPPGVGKTSLCRSIAESLGRKYVRMSLGGLHDESEIRGHRRTYIASMCGRVMKNFIKAESNNPVFVLDEIDKVSGSNHNGDPQSALLELLDPEQNSAFHDNYLDFDYDVSQALFVATANNIAQVPAPLRDRMELINVEGYLTEEKKEIARRHLIPNELKNLQLPFDFKIAPSATEFLIENYTRESGVRQLEKQIAKLVRKIVLQAQISPEGCPPFAANGSLKINDIKQIMGTPPYNRNTYQGNDYAGVVTGLAWTPVGGEILFVESSINRAKSQPLTLTGNLGDVMKESALIALEVVKSHAEHLGIDHRIFQRWTLHIHVPEGATPKDGPSAGITMATSMVSIFTQRKVQPHLAMTGELSLRGKVLPVGGIKEKILAAKRAGIRTIILSADNKKDIDDIPARYVEGLTFHFVEHIKDVWQLALMDEKVKHPIDLSIADKETRDENQPTT